MPRSYNCHNYQLKDRHATPVQYCHQFIHSVNFCWTAGIKLHAWDEEETELRRRSHCSSLEGVRVETGWTGLPEGSSASDASEEGVHSIPEGPHEQGGIWAEWVWAKPFLGIIFLTQGLHPCSSFFRSILASHIWVISLHSGLNTERPSWWSNLK